ncbi:hypothetical protein [Streptosporangium sandarakinum]
MGTAEGQSPSKTQSFIPAEKEGEMGEFSSTIENRLDQAYKNLHEAESTGDQYLADTFTAEIEDLHRLATDNGVHIRH